MRLFRPRYGKPNIPELPITQRIISKIHEWLAKQLGETSVLLDIQFSNDEKEHLKKHIQDIEKQFADGYLTFYYLFDLKKDDAFDSCTEKASKIRAILPLFTTPELKKLQVLFKRGVEVFSSIKNKQKYDEDIKGTYGREGPQKLFFTGSINIGGVRHEVKEDESGLEFIINDGKKYYLVEDEDRKISLASDQLPTFTISSVNTKRF